MTRAKKREPLTPAERVRASEARKIEAGGMRLPGGILPPDAAGALQRLVAAGWADSATGAIARALVEADRRRRPRK